MKTNSNTVSGDYSVVPGGLDNEITSNTEYSLAFGRSVSVSSDYIAAFFSSSYKGKLGINEPDPHSTLHYDGSEASAWAEKTANYTLTGTDHTIFVDGNGVTLTLPDPDPTTGDNCPGRIYYIKNASSDDADSVDVDPSSTVTIDGETNLYLHSMEGWIIQADDDEWWIIAKF